MPYLSAAVAGFCCKRLNMVRLKHRTMATGTLPKFGGRITDAESNFAEHMTDFSVEMFRCSRRYDGSLQEVKILHTSMDLEVVQHETYKIIQHMRDEGFDVKHENYQNSVFREEWAGTNWILKRYWQAAACAWKGHKSCAASSGLAAFPIFIRLQRPPIRRRRPPAPCGQRSSCPQASP